MATKLIPGQWYDDAGSDRLLAITENDVACRDFEGVIFIHTLRYEEIAKFTHLPDCDGWDWQPPKPPLQVEVGKTYRMRNGETTKISRMRNPEEANYCYPYIGSNSKSYKACGSELFSQESQYDLIEEIPEPEPDYLDIHKASGLKVGDTVKIEKKTEPKGWCAHWNPSMDAEIGKVGSVARNESGSGFRVKADSSYEWYFPATSLVKVEPKWRPFANLDEAEPFYDQPVRLKGHKHRLRITELGHREARIGSSIVTYEVAVENYELLDGTPFGIKVLE